MAERILRRPARSTSGPVARIERSEIRGGGEAYANSLDLGLSRISRRRADAQSGLPMLRLLMVARRQLLPSRLAVPARRTPTLERSPDGAFQPKLIERRRRANGADAIKTDAGPLEAAFLQHAPRSRVAGARPGGERRMEALAES